MQELAIVNSLHTQLQIMKGWEPEWSIPQLNVGNGLKCPKNGKKKGIQWRIQGGGGKRGANAPPFGGE